MDNLKSFIKRGFFWSVSRSRTYRLLEPLLGGVGIILMLHRVLPEARRSRFAMNRNIEISSDTLEKVIDLFKRAEFDFVSLDECRKRILGKRVERRCVTFTFDDGYLDNYEHAYPILRRKEVPFTIYVASSFPNRQMPTWWYALEQLILAKDDVSFHHNKRKYAFPCGTVDQMHATFASIHHMILLAESRTVYQRLIEEVFSDWDGDAYNCPGALPMRWEHIIELSKDELVEIGAHTMSHAPLTCQSERDARSEIQQSKEDLEERTGLPVLHFAYPYGMQVKRDREIVNESGFLTATTTWPGNLHHAHKNSLERLPRIAITDEALDGDYLDLMISGVRPFVDNSFSKVMRSS